MARSRRNASGATATAPGDDGPHFAWGPGASFKVSPDVVGRELERLEIEPGQFHRSKDVLDAARDKDSPLHAAFTWDNRVAGEKYRLQEARAMLRSIRLVYEKEQKQVSRPVYVHIRDAGGPKYVRAEKMLTDAEIRKAAIREVMTLLNGIRKKYAFLKDELPLIFATIEGWLNDERR